MTQIANALPLVVLCRLGDSLCWLPYYFFQCLQTLPLNAKKRFQFITPGNQIRLVVEGTREFTIRRFRFQPLNR